MKRTYDTYYLLNIIWPVLASRAFSKCQETNHIRILESIEIHNYPNNVFVISLLVFAIKDIGNSLIDHKIAFLFLGAKIKLTLGPEGLKRYFWFEVKIESISIILLERGSTQTRNSRFFLSKRADSRIDKFKVLRYSYSRLLFVFKIEFLILFLLSLNVWTCSKLSLRSLAVS